MKNLKSKALLLTLIIAATSCDDQIFTRIPDNIKADSYNRWTGKDFKEARYDGFDGGPLDNSIASTWINNYKKVPRQNKNSRTQNPMQHYFSKETIRSILAQEGCTGLRIYYALDDSGTSKLIISAVSSNGHNILNVVPILGVTKSEANSDRISYDIAQDWIGNYQEGITSYDIKSHYFGKNGILAVLAQEDCIGLIIYHALNDDNAPRLLIAGTTSDDDGNSDPNSSTGRLIGLGDLLPLIIDFSFPCPSTCGNGDGGL